MPPKRVNQMSPDELAMRDAQVRAIYDASLAEIEVIRDNIQNSRGGISYNLNELYDAAMNSLLRERALNILDEFIAQEETEHHEGMPVSNRYASFVATRANIVETKALSSEIPKTLSLLQKAWECGVSGQPLDAAKSRMQESIDVLKQIQMSHR